MERSKCVFCDIYSGKEPARVFHKDEHVIVFSDLQPAAKHHYLVVPKEHLTNAKRLKKEHIPLVENLVKQGERILHEGQANMKDSRFGFHWPPFNSIAHLHLHVISPASQMSCFNKLVFHDSNLWFVKPQYVLQRLARL